MERSQEASERKQRTEAILGDRSIPFLDSLPVVESTMQIVLRDPARVAARSMCLVLVADVALGHDPKFCIDLLESSPLVADLTPAERQFLSRYETDADGRRERAWGIEAAYALLWSLNHVRELRLPTSETSLDDVYGCLPSSKEALNTFIDTGSLIQASAVLDQLDMVYRLHWSARHDEATDLNRDVVQEWHRSLNWLTSYANLDWDDVTTDT